MKRRNTLLALTMFTALALPAAALADENTRQVWRDSEAQVVHNTFGNCVRGNWENSVDVCGAPPPQVVTYVPPPPPRTIIAEADRTVYFPFNVANLTPEDQQKLSELATRINSASDVQDAQVVGYADRIGTTSYNEKLSKKRAENVRDYLIGQNVVTENETVTRWVGKTESNTQCPGKLSHDQLIQCLAPDRKVTVELKYKTIEQTQPQTNAAPIPGEQPPGDWSGQAPQQQSSADQAADQYPVSEVIAPPPTMPNVAPGEYTSDAIVPMPITDTAASATADQQTSHTQPPEPALPEQAETNIQTQSNISPVDSVQSGDVMGGSAQSYKPSVEIFPAPQPSVEQQNTDAQPYVGQPPLPSIAESHQLAPRRQYASQDVVQPSDEYRYRTLTTGE